MLGFAIGSVSAWLGGHLAFGEQIGVDHTATADAGQPENFTPVILESALEEGKPTRVEANGVRIMLVRRNGEIHAISDTCPHLGGPLSEGKLMGDVIECPWHGSRFRIDDGSVVGGPATQSARCYEVRVVEGNVEVKGGVPSCSQSASAASTTAR
jgi:nitrite reductase/ring-hydroxylating ferredoxin subunit